MKLIQRTLCSPDAADPTGAPPPAAETVRTGTKTERERELEAKLDTEEKARKKAELDAARWQDEHKTLLTAQEQAAREANEQSKPKKSKVRWTLLHEED